MSSRQIRVSEEAYERLRRRKREGESFGDVVERLLDARDEVDVEAGAGLWAGTEKAAAAREHGAELAAEMRTTVDRATRLAERRGPNAPGDGSEEEP